MANPSIYTVGGTVQAGGGIYIPRQADEELLALCRAGTFAYILAPRQVGKSSLMVRTAEQLADEGIQSVIIDLTQLGVQVTAEEWYLGLLTIIADQLMLDTDVLEWWQSLKHLGITQRLTRFFEEILLVEIAIPLVIFVDEIDTTLSLDFTDDFFAAIRYLYNGRARLPKFQRLSFVLIGVATPGDLIRDSKRTPFNIGQRVELTDFNLKEALALADGLGLPLEQSQQTLKWVLKWTGGHPYLTQRLCRAITEQDKNNWSQAEVERVVNSTFFGAMSKQDNNLQFVRDMLTKRAPDVFAVLTTYSEIRRGKRIVLDEEQSLVKSHLKLSGIIVRREHASLCVRNLIYRKVFDERWLKEHLAVPLKMLTVQTVVLTSVVTTILIVGMRLLGVLEAGELSAFDLMMRSRPEEGLDPRLLIITIDDDDLATQRRNGESLIGASISEKSLNKLLAKLNQYQPRAIGLDIYADFQVRRPDLITRLQQTQNLVGLCKGSDSAANIKGIKPPPEIPIENLGFSNFIHDRDGVIRRHLLFMNQEVTSLCSAPFAFSLQLAFFYLRPSEIQSKFTPEGNLQLGKTIFPNLKSRTGGYQGIDAKGGQILLNYRSSKEIAEQVKLTQFLSSPINPSAIKDRIILIGVTAKGDSPDTWPTPYGVPLNEQMPGVLLQAHMISQILSAVQDGRPLLRVWSLWIEVVWIWGWSLVGGMLARQWRSLPWLVLAVGVTSSVLYVVCFVLLIWGIWVPFLPSLLALMATSGNVAGIRIALQKQEMSNIS
ncbi:MAG: CHASE2 domain-containing protein [Nostoc sp.]|uniref:CHASE2 domain-containing protein n=1 Tax=Nostoc sp. TaxID=1180 RepID=UPI002FF50CB8